MQQDGTNYSADPVEHLETVVGDEKQPVALPRVKIKGWDNEVNLSVGVIHDETIDHTMTLDGDKAIWEQGDVSASFEPLVCTTTPDTHISLIDEGEISPQRMAAEYEVDRYFRWGQTVRINSSNKKAMMYYGFYNANEFVDRSKLDIPEVRLSSVNSWNDPMTMDSKLVLIDVHYDKNQDDPNKIHEHTIAAIIEVLARYGVEAYHKEHTYKLYYKDGDKDVKFFSTSLYGGQYYYYINLGHDYNGALAYSNEPNAVPRSDKYAYGLPDTLPDTIITEIIERYAELYGLPLVPRVFTPVEEAKIAEIETIHDNENWIVNGKRDDVWRLTADEQNEPGFEFDITLATKPDTNVYTMSIETKGLIFGKQDAIPDDKAKTEYRSPRITNSYAVYHESKQNNEYKSGKAFHIYRPIIKDANGWEVWGDLDIDTEMRITIPQDFIDNATYPIVIDPTFGYSTQGASYVGSGNVVLASDATISGVGNLAAVVGTVFGGGSANVAGIYDSSGSLMYTSLAVSGVPAANFFSSLPTLPAADYRIAYSLNTLGGYSAGSLYYDTVAGTSYSLTRTYDGTLPANMDSFTTETTRRYTLYGITGYQWPIMVGNSTILAATTAVAGLDTGSATPWVTTNNNNIIAPTDTAFHDFRFNLTTAPGGVTERKMQIDSASLFVNIVGAATTATNSTSVNYSLAGAGLNITHVPTGVPATSTINTWRLAATNDNQGWYSSSIAALSTTLTRYIGVQDASGVSTTAAAATVTMPNDTGNILNARCALLDGALSAGSYAITLVKNGSPTAMVMTITGTTANYTGSIAVLSGDTLYWQIVPSTGTIPSNARRVAISCEYKSDTAGNGVIFGGSNTNISGTTYSSAYDAWNGTEANINQLAYTHTMKGLRVDLSAAPAGAATRTVALRIGGATQTPSVTVTGAALFNSWTGSQAIATDNIIDMIHTTAGGPAASNVKYAYIFAATAFTTQTYAPQMLLKGVG